MYQNIPAEKLGEGWYWHKYNDDSGCLIDPAGYKRIHYDLYTREFEFGDDTYHFDIDEDNPFALMEQTILKDMPEIWKLLDSKSVPDFDGCRTDYTLYENISAKDEPKYVCVFGDNEMYHPEDHDYDWYSDTYDAAKEWFDNYEGFEEPDTEQDFYETCGGAVSIPVSDFTKAMFDKDKSLDVEPERKMPSIHEQISDAEVRADVHNAGIDLYEPDDLEVGFNAYLGSYDFDC